MRTTGDVNGNTWTCAGLNQFDEVMVKAHNSLESSSCKTWDTVYVTRNSQELGNLYNSRQCLELYENEMEKWGCNGLVEEFSDQGKPKPAGCYFWYVPRTFERLALLVCLKLSLCACD